MTGKNLRTSLNPSLILTFIIVGITGIIMMFHIDAGGIKHLHEWMSMIFLILCIIHLCLNWKILLAYLKNRVVVVSSIGVCLLTVLLLMSGGDRGKGHYGESRSGHYKQLNYKR